MITNHGTPDDRCRSLVLECNVTPSYDRPVSRKYIHTYIHTYKVISKIFETDAVKIVKLTIRPIGHRRLRSSSLPHVDTDPTVSSIFGKLPGSPFLSEYQALSAVRPVSPQCYQTGVLSASISFLEIGRSHRVPHQASTVGGE